MKRIRTFRVDGQTVDVPENELNEFFAAFNGANVVEVESYDVTNEQGENERVDVPENERDEFLRTFSNGGAQPNQIHRVQMDDGSESFIGDAQARAYVDARRNGSQMSRGLLRTAGIPDWYGKTVEDREALADNMAEWYPQVAQPQTQPETAGGEMPYVEHVPDRYDANLQGRGNENTNFGDDLMAFLRTGKKVAEETGKNLVFHPESEWGEWLENQDGILGEAIRGGNDISNKMVQSIADAPAAVNDVAAGLVGTGERLAGGDGELSQRMRGNSAAYRQNLAEALPTDTAYVDENLKPVNDFVGDTLTTIGKFALPGMAPVAISADTINSYYDAYERAMKSGMPRAKAEALAVAAAGVTSAVGTVLGKAAKGARGAAGFKGALADMAVTGGEMGALGGAGDVIEQRIEGAENVDLGRAAKVTGKEALKGAAFSGVSRAVHSAADAGKRDIEKEARRMARERAEAEAKENARAEAKARYEANLSDEASFDLGADIDAQVKSGTIPEDAREMIREKVIEGAGKNKRSLEDADVREHAVIREVDEHNRVVDEYNDQELRENRKRLGEANHMKIVDDIARADEHAARQEDIEAAFRDYVEPPKKVPDGKGRMVDAPDNGSRMKNVSDEMKAKVKGDEEMQAIIKSAKNATDEADKEELQSAFDKRWRELEAEREGGATAEEKSAVETQTNEPTADTHAANVEKATKIIADQVRKVKGHESDKDDTYRSLAESIVKMTENKDADGLISLLHNGNKGSIRAFGEITGLKMPSSQRDRNKIIDEYCGVSPDQRAEIDDKRAAERKANEEQQNKEWRIQKGRSELSGKTFSDGERHGLSVEDLVADGFRPEKVSRGAASVIELRKGTRFFKMPGGTYEYLAELAKNSTAQTPPKTTAETSAPKAEQTHASAMDVKDAAKVLGTDAYLPEKDLQKKLAAWKKNVNFFTGDRKAKAQAQIDAAEQVLAARKERATAENKSAVASAFSNATNERLVNHIKNPKGALKTAAEEELRKRGLDKNGEPLSTPTSRESQDTSELKDLIAKAKASGKDKYEKDGKGYKLARGKEASIYEVKVGTTTLRFADSPDGIAKAEKMLKKLSTVKDWTPKDNKETIPAAPTDIRIATGKSVKGFGDVAKDFLGKDPIRKLFTTPIVQGGYRYATDGIVAFRMKNTDGANDTKGAPNLNPLFDRPEPKRTFDVDVASLGKSLAAVKGVDNKNDSVHVWIQEDGTLAFQRKCTFGNKTEVEDNGEAAAFAGTSLKNAEYLGTFGLDYLTKTFKAFGKIGDGKVKVEWNGESAPIYFVGRNGEATIAPKTVRIPSKTAAEYKSGKRNPLDDPAKPEGGSIADTVEELDRLISEEEAANAKGNADGEGKELNDITRSDKWQHGSGVSKAKELLGGLKSRNSIIHKAKNIFPEFAFRGETSAKVGPTVNGYWKHWNELIRSKDTASLDTIPHEIGHGIDSMTRRGGLVVPSQAAKRELVKLGRALYGNERPNGGYMGEGFAEYIRGRISGADNLDTECPNLHKWFNEEFTKSEKGRDMLRRVDQLANEVMQYRKQTNIQKFAAFMRPSVGKIEKAAKAVSSVFTQEKWNDEGATLTKAYKKSNLAELHRWQPKMRELEDEIKKNGNGSARAQQLSKEIDEQIKSDPRIFASNVRGTSQARTLDMFKNGVTDIRGISKIGNVTGFDSRGNPIRDNCTESARDIFRDFSKEEFADWQKYAAAKVGLENYVKEGRDFGYPEKDLQDIISTYETPKFENALQRFSDFTRRSLSVGLECGAMTPEQYQAIVGAHKYYVRTERRFDENAGGVGKGQANPLHKIKGSQRNIMDPFTATMMQTERQLRYFQTMKTLQLIGRDVKKAQTANSKRETGKPSGVDYHIAANLPTIVPNAQEAVKFTSEKIKKDFTERAAKHYKDQGEQFPISMAEKLYEDMYGADGDQLTVFREKPSNGKNGVVSTYIDGELVTFEIPDAAWEKYITGMESENWSPKSAFGKTLWGMATLPAKTLRLGATTLNPSFTATNAMRDTFHAAVMSDDNTTVPVASTLRGMLEMAKGNNGMTKLWKSMGGENAMLTGSSTEGRWKKGTKEVLADGKLEETLNGFDPRNPMSYLNPLGGAVKAWADLLSIPETAPRIREMKGVYDRAKAAGLSDESAASLAFANAKDISIDFGKHGEVMKYINQVIPYTNAWYRGMEQFVRNMGLTDALPHQFADGRARKAGKTAAKAIGWITAGTMANALAKMMTMDEDERRAEFKKIPTEKWDYNDVLGVRVANPFELGAVFGSIPKAMVYEAFGDKGAVKEAVWHAIETNVGKYSSVEDITSGIALIAPWVDIARNEKWNGSPIVSPQLKNSYDKKDWADQSTTEMAKWIGAKMDWAPAYIDHVVNSYTGGLYKRVASPASDPLGTFMTGVSSLKPRPLARRDVNDFYNFTDKANRAYSSGEVSLEDLGKLSRAEKLKDELSPMFREMRNLSKNYPDHDERTKKREEIMNKAFDLIKKFDEDTAKDREKGIEKAAVSLTTPKPKDLSDAVKTKNVAALKDVDFKDAAMAIRRYGRRNAWSDETISKRIIRLKTRLGR